jgi:lysophospholipase L1-like esterase
MVKAIGATQVGCASYDYAKDIKLRFRVLLPIAALVLAGGCADFRVPDPAVLYIAFGDSSTAGPSERDYPDILRELLGEPRETFANEGNGGEAASEGLVRLEALISNDLYPNAEVLLYWQGGNEITDFIREFDPFLLLSPNDADYPFTEVLTRQLEATQDNLESAIAMARGAGLEVFVATYYFVDESFGVCQAFPLDLVLPQQAQKANEYLLLLNERIRAASANQAAILVDVAILDDALRADRENYFDCNHLSAQGNAFVAELFFDVIAAVRS